MHFSKTYTALLASLPQELRANAIQYRQLKKLINQVVLELATLGLNPTALHALLGPSDAPELGRPLPKVVYELDTQDDRIEPRLRVLSTGDQPAYSTLWALQQKLTQSDFDDSNSDEPREIIIPLVSDTAFFQLLSTALKALSSHLLTVHTNFLSTLVTLSRQISDSARPLSANGSFHSLGSLSNPSGVSAPLRSSSSNKSDLYSWREIFHLYMEAEVFESPAEADRGERPVEESERRLTLFAERVSQRGLGDTRKLRLKESRDALETFLGLNVFILHVKKFQLANSEAIRKILKKHAKRTALPIQHMDALTSINTPPTTTISSELTTTMTHPTSTTRAILSLPHILVQAIGETLLPIIPTVADYECLICTSIAFKPIRLFCGHLFCVRCLVKMQKRGQGDCPMCRAPTVLRADRSNVDWALLNFMQDWFPDEAREKLRRNEREASDEALIELGLDPNQKCCIM